MGVLVTVALVLAFCSKVDVMVIVEMVLKTDVTGVGPEDTVDVKGQEVTISYVTSVVVPSSVVDGALELGRGRGLELDSGATPEGVMRREEAFGLLDGLTIEVGIAVAELVKEALPLSALILLACCNKFEVIVTVETVLKIDVTGVPPGVPGTIDVIGQVVTASYVTRVVVPS